MLVGNVMCVCVGWAAGRIGCGQSGDGWLGGNGEWRDLEGILVAVCEGVCSVLVWVMTVFSVVFLGRRRLWATGVDVGTSVCVYVCKGGVGM